MMKHLTMALVVMAFLGAATAQAAPPAQLSGKVVAVEDGKIKLAVDGELPAWAKASAPVKFAEGTGKILEVSAPDASPVVLTIKTKLASKLKAGDAVKLDKGKSMQGC